MTRRSSSACLSEKEIEDFLFDRLSGVTRETVEEHLLVCHPCLDKVEAEERYISTFRDAAGKIEIEDLEASYAGVRPAESGKPGLIGRLAQWFWPRSGFNWKPALGLVMLATLTLIVVPRLSFDRTPVDVELSTVRGGSPAAAPASPASHPVSLRLDIAEIEPLPYYLAQLADAQGKIIESAELEPQSGRLSWSLKSPSAGQYWVRLLKPGPSPILLREFSYVVN